MLWHNPGYLQLRTFMHAPDSDKPHDSGFVANYLLYLLAAASDAASAQFHSRVRDCGLRVPEWRVLACLHDRDGEMITRLAEIALIEQSRLTRIIDQMHSQGWVKRGGDKHDRRRVRVYLTAKGSNMAARLVSEARQHEAELLRQLRAQQGKDIRQVLRALIEHLRDDSS